MIPHILKTGDIKMSKWDKLLLQILNLSKNLRFAELKKVLESEEKNNENY